MPVWDIYTYTMLVYTIFGFLWGMKLVPLAKTQGQRWITLGVGGPLIWILFMYYLTRVVIFDKK